MTLLSADAASGYFFCLGRKAALIVVVTTSIQNHIEPRHRFENTPADGESNVILPTCWPAHGEDGPPDTSEIWMPQLLHDVHMTD